MQVGRLFRYRASSRKLKFSPELYLAHQKAFTASQFLILFCHITRARDSHGSDQVQLFTSSGEEDTDTVLVTARSCRQRGVASGEAKVANPGVQQLCDTNFHLLTVSVIMQLQTTTPQKLDCKRLKVIKVFDEVRLPKFHSAMKTNKSSYPASAATACPLHFLRSWCLTMRKGAPNPLPKNAHIIASSRHLLSTENGRF